MATNYRISYTRLTTGDILGELPVTGPLSFSNVLDAPGSLQATVPLTDYLSLEPARTAIYVERDGVVLWSRVLWTLEVDVKAGEAHLGAEGWLSLFRRRFITSDTSFYQVEQTSIAASLVTQAQAGTGADLGITPDVTATGVLRDRNYLASDRGEVAQLLQNLAAVRGGFHFAFPAERGPSGFNVRFTAMGPETGRPTDLVFDAATNVEVLTVTSDGTDMANQSEVRSGGSGDDTVAWTSYGSGVGTSTPLLQSVETASDVKEVATLQEKADHRIQVGAEPLVIPTISIPPNADPPLGSYFVGDRVTVKASTPALTVDGEYVITTVAVKLKGADESVDLNFAPVESFTDV